MKIACVQMNIVFADPEKNFLTVEKYVEEAAKAQAGYRNFSRNVEFGLCA
ncbi:nitrilase-related carbon-nitrogen hydrolase [Bacillus sp. Bva_UNVM-123]